MNPALENLIEQIDGKQQIAMVQQVDAAKHIVLK